MKININDSIKLKCVIHPDFTAASVKTVNNVNGSLALLPGFERFLADLCKMRQIAQAASFSPHFGPKKSLSYEGDGSARSLSGSDV